MKIAHMLYRGFSVFNLVLSFGFCLVMLYLLISGDAHLNFSFLLFFFGFSVAGLLVLSVLRRSWNLFLKDTYSGKSELLDDMLEEQKPQLVYNYSAVDGFYFLFSLIGVCCTLYASFTIFSIRYMLTLGIMSTLLFLYTISWCFQLYHAIIVNFVIKHKTKSSS